MCKQWPMPTDKQLFQEIHSGVESGLRAVAVHTPAEITAPTWAARLTSHGPVSQRVTHSENVLSAQKFTDWVNSIKRGQNHQSKFLSAGDEKSSNCKPELYSSLPKLGQPLWAKHSKWWQTHPAADASDILQGVTIFHWVLWASILTQIRGYIYTHRHV